MSARILLLLFFATLLSAQSNLTLTNGASQAPGVTPGSLAFLSFQPGGAGILPVQPPDSVSRVAVRFQAPGDTGSGTSVPAAAIFSPTAAQVLVPESLSVGTVHVTLTLDGQELASGDADLVRTAPGLFTVGGIGIGPAVAQNVTPSGAVTNALTSPALPDSYVTLWLTGLGDATAQDLKVELAGTPVDVLYAGHNAPGLDQVNVRLPANPYLGCYVSLIVRARDAVSREVGLSVSNSSSACAHPLGLSYQEMQTLDSGGMVVAPYLSISESRGANTTTPDNYVNGGSFRFISQAAPQIFLMAGIQKPVPADGICTSVSSTRTVGVATFPASLDVGSEIDMMGPGGVPVTLPGTGVLNPGPNVPLFNLTSNTEQPLFVPGDWSASSQGGADVLPFQVPFHLPPVIQFLNRDALATIDRSTDLTVRWDPQGYGGGDIVTVNLLSHDESTLLAQVSCQTHAWAGSLTVPKDLLQTIPPSTDTQGVLSVNLSPLNVARMQFQLPRPDGDPWHGVASYTFSDSVQPAIQ